MAANFDLLIVHGPPSPALPSILKHKFSIGNYILVHPSRLFRDNPDFGVRDIANHVISLLRKHRKVVVEDTSANAAVRDCLLKVIPSKISSCTVGVIEMVPKYGKLQALWDRQFYLATSSEPDHLLPDELLLCWFDEEGRIVSSSDSIAMVNVPKETIRVNLTASSHFKFEVPALLIQWECVVDSGGFLEHKIASACQHWTAANPFGRVVLLCDGSSIARGLISAAQETNRIISCSKALANELPSPVYVIQLTSTLEAGEFCVPPKPGLLAFLHRRHHLGLQHQNTVYVYSDVRHMQMSEKAGVRHLKIGKVLRNPETVSSCHWAVASPVPEMLQQMRLVPGTDGSAAHTTSLPSIPLADCLERFADHHICVDHRRGHREFVFAKDVQHLQSFQKTYAKHATLAILEEPNSGHVPPSSGLTSPNLDLSSSSNFSAVKEVVVEKSQLRQIPKWMLGTGSSSSENLSTQFTREKSAIKSSEDGNCRSRQTIYIMTERELMETAEEILKQAGKDSVLSSVDAQQVEKEDVSCSTKVDEGAFLPAPEKCRAHCNTTDLDSSLATGITQSEDAIPTENKRLRLAPTTTGAESHQDDPATNLNQSRLATQASDQSKVKSEKKKTAYRPAPDLSALDDIFS